MGPSSATRAEVGRPKVAGKKMRGGSIRKLTETISWYIRAKRMRFSTVCSMAAMVSRALSESSKFGAYRGLRKKRTAILSTEFPTAARHTDCFYEIATED